MQLDVRGVAAILNVRESTVYRWIHERKMPAKGVGGRYRFGRAELLEWATAHKINVSPDFFAEESDNGENMLLADALGRGGIFYDVPGTDKNSALRSVVDRIPLPEGCQADLILQLFLAREAMGSTSVGGGVAIPHPRHPVVLRVAEPSLSLCFLSAPIDFSARDGELVHTLFVLLSPSVQSHLQMLARIASLLADARFAQVLAARASRDEVLADVRRVEATFNSRAANGSEH
jgi:PTS system nitrogen regulatory IIA component